MALESATHINDLVTTNPAGTDSRTTADDHLRLIKDVLKRDLPLTAAVTSTAAELNLLTGKALSSSDNVIDNFPAGTLMLFQQTAAPTGWTKQTTHNDKALRVVSGTASNGGTTPFTTVFGITATDSHILTEAEMPRHIHSMATGNALDDAGTFNYESSTNFDTGTTSTNATGNDIGHTHNIDMVVQYVDLIIASKD